MFMMEGIVVIRRGLETVLLTQYPKQDKRNKQKTSHLLTIKRK